MEDEALAEQGEEASLLAGCRNLLRAVTKVSKYSSQKIVGPKNKMHQQNKEHGEEASLLTGSRNLLRAFIKVRIVGENKGHSINIHERSETEKRAEMLLVLFVVPWWSHSKY